MPTACMNNSVLDCVIRMTRILVQQSDLSLLKDCYKYMSRIRVCESDNGQFSYTTLLQSYYWFKNFIIMTQTHACILLISFSDYRKITLTII